MPQRLELMNLAEQLTREQIIERCQRKMIAALEGRLKMQEVCGLSIESLRAALIAERTRLLKRYGYEEIATHPGKPPASIDKKENDH